MALLLQCVFLVGLASLVTSQTYSPGICPTYQTSEQFNNTKIGKITEQQGYTTVMYTGLDADEDRKCLRLRLLDRSKYTLSYIDTTNNIMRVEGAYDSVSSGYTEPGFIELRGGSYQVMAADILGNTRLHPLLITNDYDVYVSCTSYGLFYSENVYVIAPYFTDATKMDYLKIKSDLIDREVPKAQYLKPVDQTCDVPGAVFTPLEESAAEEGGVYIIGEDDNEIARQN